MPTGRYAKFRARPQLSHALGLWTPVGFLDARGSACIGKLLFFVSCFTKRRGFQNVGNDRARARCMWHSAGVKTGSNVGRNAERSTNWDQTGTKSLPAKSCVFSGRPSQVIHLWVMAWKRS
jgi:hypothetical protein